MTMEFNFDIRGAKELERVFEQLPKSVGKQVLRKIGKRAMKPVERTAKALAPTGSFKESIRTTTKLSNRQKRRRAAAGAVEVFVGSTRRDAHLIEFGTGPRWQKTTGRYTGIVDPSPFMRPAWDIHKNEVLAVIRRDIWKEVGGAAERLSRQARTGKLSKSNRRALS